MKKKKTPDREHVLVLPGRITQKSVNRIYTKTRPRACSNGKRCWHWNGAASSHPTFVHKPLDGNNERRCPDIEFACCSRGRLAFIVPVRSCLSHAAHECGRCAGRCGSTFIKFGWLTGRGRTWFRMYVLSVLRGLRDVALLDRFASVFDVIVRILLRVLSGGRFVNLSGGYLIDWKSLCEGVS